MAIGKPKQAEDGRDRVLITFYDFIETPVFAEV